MHARAFFSMMKISPTISPWFQTFSSCAMRIFFRLSRVVLTPTSRYYTYPTYEEGSQFAALLLVNWEIWKEKNVPTF